MTQFTFPRRRTSSPPAAIAATTAIYPAGLWRAYHRRQMNASAPLTLVTAKRLSRLSLWLCLTVTWFAAHVLAHLAPHASHRALNHYASVARLLLVASALQQNAPSSRRRLRPAAARRLSIRRAAGPALRRTLRQGSFAQRAGAICAALAAPERWLAAITRRLRRGFTKLGRLPTPRRMRERAPARAPRPPQHAVNSS